MKFPIIAAGLLLASATQAPAATSPVLTVLTYDSFISDWGPGPAVKKAFQKTCACTLKFVGAGDGAALLARLELEGKRSKADVVLGLDTNLTTAAAATGLFAPHPKADLHFDMPIAWTDPIFLPYDWGYFAFVYDKTKLADPPTSFKALAASKLKIVIEDPRSSTPGLGLLMWIKAAYGDRAGEIWRGLADNIVTVTKGWSEAYGMFLHGEADMVLSYTTSPAYHLIEEKDASKAAAPFSEGHYMQVEVMGKLAASKHPHLADEFMAFMLSNAVQGMIPTTNWMYPARTPAAGLPAGYETLIKPAKALYFPAAQAARLRDPALAEWLAALSR